MCGSPGLTTRQLTLPHLDSDSFQVVPVFPGREPALDLHPLVMEDQLYVRGFQQPKRRDATDRMLEDLRSLCYTLLTTICLHLVPVMTTRAGGPFTPEHWVNLFVRPLLYVLRQSDGFSPATQKVPRWEVFRPGLGCRELDLGLGKVGKELLALFSEYFPEPVIVR